LAWFTALVEVVVVMETCAEVVVVAGFDVVVVVVELLQDASIKADTIKILKPNQITLFSFLLLLEIIVKI